MPHRGLPHDKSQMPAGDSKTKKRDIWDDSLREQLFAVLAWEFGPLKFWEAKSRPFKSGTAFKEFLDKMAQHMGNLHGHELSPDAIKSQINYVLQRPKGASFNVGHQDNFKRNIKAAVKAGFISLEDLKKRLGGGGGRPDAGRDERDQQRQMQRGRERQQRREPQRSVGPPQMGRADAKMG